MRNSGLSSLWKLQELSVRVILIVAGGGGGGGIGYQVSDITSTKCSFGYFSLDTPTPFAVLTVFFWIIRKTPTPFCRLLRY